LYLIKPYPSIFISLTSYLVYWCHAAVNCPIHRNIFHKFSISGCRAFTKHFLWWFWRFAWPFWNIQVSSILKIDNIYVTVVYNLTLVEVAGFFSWRTLKVVGFFIIVIFSFQFHNYVLCEKDYNLFFSILIMPKCTNICLRSKDWFSMK
jgi:hypothetical protein